MPPVHDYVIDNSTGANVRADINNALAAIVSNNSSSSQPATRYAYMWWADTTTGILKIRNSANDGWVELLQLDGTLTLEDGSASTPGLAFRDDLNTGIFSSAADTFNVATGGVERMELGATTIFNESGADVDFRIEGDSEANLFYVDAGNNHIGINDSTPSVTLDITGEGGGNGEIHVKRTSGASCFIQAQSATAVFGSNSNHILQLKSNSTTALTIDTSQRLLIGHTSSLSIGSGDSLPLQVSSTNAPVFGGVRYVNSSSGPFLSLAKSRAGSAGSNTIVQVNDDLGTILFAGDDGTDLISKGASISAAVDGTPGSNDMPGRLVFSTTADGAVSPSERLRIDKNGHMGLGVTPDDGWPSNGDFTAFQLGTGACVFGRGSGDEDRGGLAVNYYATGSGNKFLANGHANLVYLNDGNIDFYTSAQNTSGADAALSLLHVMQINTSKNVNIIDGDLIIGTAGHGIDFSAQTATSASGATTSSEVLDHYEEGTFTPFNPSLTATDLQGHYTRIGRVVHCSIYITIPSNSNGNDFVIDGLPFNTFNPDPSVGASLQGGYVIYSNYSAAVLVRTNQGGDRILVNSIGGNNIQLTTLDNINFRIGLHYFTT
jgi:hypothetical protein